MHGLVIGNGTQTFILQVGGTENWCTTRKRLCSCTRSAAEPGWQHTPEADRPLPPPDGSNTCGATQIVVLANEVWRGVSARAAFAGEPPSEDKGLNRVTAGLTFTRWDARRPADVDNLLLLTFDEASDRS